MACCTERALFEPRRGRCFNPLHRLSRKSPLYVLFLSTLAHNNSGCHQRASSCVVIATSLGINLPRGICMFYFVWLFLWFVVDFGCAIFKGRKDDERLLAHLSGHGSDQDRSRRSALQIQYCRQRQASMLRIPFNPKFQFLTGV